MLSEPTRCWYCGNWKSTADAQCGVCGNSGKEKLNGNATKHRKQITGTE